MGYYNNFGIGFAWKWKGKNDTRGWRDKESPNLDVLGRNLSQQANQLFS